MKSNALPKEAQEPAGKQNVHGAGNPRLRFQPRTVRPGNHTNGNTDQLLRMYTEHEISEILQVSLSQLRKWRMRKQHGNTQGPPFRKIGRLVRYSGTALRAYINGDEQDAHLNQE